MRLPPPPRAWHSPTQVWLGVRVLQPLLSSWLERLGESVAVPYSTSVNLVSVPEMRQSEAHRCADRTGAGGGLVPAPTHVQQAPELLPLPH